MKAIVRGLVHSVVEAHADHLELDTDLPGVTILVPYSEPTLIVEPTDDDLTAAASPGGCDVCPHENYLTIDLEMRVHECESCGAHFTDVGRPMRYFYHRGIDRH